MLSINLVSRTRKTDTLYRKGIEYPFFIFDVPMDYFKYWN